MLIIKKFNLLITLALLISITFLSDAKAATIPSTDIDTFKITLTGTVLNPNILNDVSGINLRVKIKDHKGDISPSFTFSSNGASALFSSVTGPFGDEFVLTVALNGNIKDGKAVFTGMFVANSLLPGAELNIVKVERDGSTDLTNSLLADFEFKNSKAPPPNPTNADSSASTPSSTNNNDTEGDAEIEVSQETQDLIDNFFSDIEGVDLDELAQALEKSTPDTTEFVDLKGASDFNLKPKGLNKYYATLKGLINTKNYNRLACSVKTVEYNLTDFEEQDVNPEYFKLPFDKFLLKLPNYNTRFRFSKRITIPLLPTGNGLKLLKNEIESLRLRINLACLKFHSQDPEIVSYESRNNIKESELTVGDIVSAYLKPGQPLYYYVPVLIFNVSPPKTANVGR